MVIFCSRPVPLSLADTLTMPLASRSNVTSTCGTPRGAGGMPSRMKRPRDLLYWDSSRSPCSTLISTLGWLSLAVEKIWLFDVGMVVLRSISLVQMPPKVSMPKDSGVTSSSSTSLTSPPRTPAWMAAPIATTSSGLTPLCGSLPKSFLTSSWMAGMRVWPPTSTTSSTSPAARPASARAWRTGPVVFSTRSSTSCSSLARLRVMFRCLGPLESAVMKGRLTSVCITVESSCLAFSAASLRRCKAMRSWRRSMPCSFLNSSASQLMMRWSKSSPPRWVSPLVDLTSNTPSPSSRMEMSKVPPPRS